MHARYLTDKLFRRLEAICKIKLASFSHALSQLSALNSQYSSSLPSTLAPLEFRELQKGLNSANESSAPTGRFQSTFSRRNLRKTDGRKLLVHDNAIADL